MSPSIMLTAAKALVKGKLHLGTLTGLERFMLAQVSLPDRVPTTLAATNVEPCLIDDRINYKILARSAEANLDLFSRVKERFAFDVVTIPVWLGLMITGTAELGVKFRIEEDRVPYACEHPITSIEDVARLQPLVEPTGYFKTTLDIYREAQLRYPDTLITYANDGPWDLAMLLRGDKNLPRDFRLYKDYVEARDPNRKEKIRKHGNPDLWPAIMAFTTQMCIQVFRLARQHGINMLGALMVDQFATKPVLDSQDYITYVLPYAQRAWEALDKKIGMFYVVPSPRELEEMLDHPVMGQSLAMYGYTNYIFPVTSEGMTLPEYDLPMFEIAKKHKKTYNYMIHGKYIRDATEQHLEGTVQRVCEMATQMRARLMLSVGAVAPGTDLNKLDLITSAVEKYGRYER